MRTEDGVVCSRAAKTEEDLDAGGLTAADVGGKGIAILSIAGIIDSAIAEVAAWRLAITRCVEEGEDNDVDSLIRAAVSSQALFCVTLSLHWLWATCMSIFMQTYPIDSLFVALCYH